MICLARKPGLARVVGSQERNPSNYVNGIQAFLERIRCPAGAAEALALLPR